MFYTEEYLPEYDAPPDYFESRERIAKKGTIYYIYSYSTMYLYYYDESTGVSGKLCGKAECMHDNTDCNAYMPFSMNFQIYNGYIYWLEDGNALYRCDMTGNNREIVQYLVDERVIFR